ncbi:MULTISPECIES: GNAT family N-acetyltransferase [Gammaproteobacteria]|uniref:GNAT family N-acetyltransferase n=1 Tax=Vreelandella halophila TaxID=86177 RepID=A0A9X4YCV6_9GAMM|nr:MULTISPECIES: GNAT family N-acetyltransferase [Gammaproteobacteria]KAA8983667.1 GNAT family N-acetyltransferase [Halospina sp. K52047b]MYL27364.1 GNAT family N-acetyltransferase [Halomonas utahensis]MYL76077.1 GNAT family N-acetyltransferase [Halomonas sp. 22501_18_FS]
MSEIRPATGQDVPAIHSLAEQWVLQGLSSAEARDYGFLVSNFTPAEYRRFTQVANAFYVLEHEGQVEAFILALTDDRISPDDPVSLSIHDYDPGPFLLVKQICSRRGSSVRGAATALYRFVSEEFSGLPQYAAIVLEPENTRSIGFHEKSGFTRCCERDAPDGRRRGIWRRSAS